MKIFYEKDGSFTTKTKGATILVEKEIFEDDYFPISDRAFEKYIIERSKKSILMNLLFKIYKIYN